MSDGLAGFDNTDHEYFDYVLASLRPRGRRAAGSVSTETHAERKDAAQAPTCSPPGAAQQRAGVELADLRSAEKLVPEFIWRGGQYVKRAFLSSLFTGDGSCSALPRGTVQVSYSTRSEQLAKDVQQLLLEFGIVSRRYRHATGEHKVVLTNRRDARLFATHVGFLGAKQDKLTGILGERRSHEHVHELRPRAGPVAAFLRRARGDVVRRPRLAASGTTSTGSNDGSTGPRRSSPISPIRTLGRSRRNWPAAGSTTPRSRTSTDAGVQPVYSLRVDTDDHSFVTDGFVSHNTECRLSPLAMAMLQDIDEDTVDFSANYDGKTQEPDVLPSRVPNLLINGSSRHRGRHGHQHPAAQPAGGRRRRRLGAREPRGHRARSCSPR